MTKEETKLLKDFFKSDLDEAEYFGVSKEGSITLEEYQARMKDIDLKFQKMAQFEVESIKKKCPWVDEVWFYGVQNPLSREFFSTSIHFFDVEGRQSYVYYDKSKGKYWTIWKPNAFSNLSRKFSTDINRYYEVVEKLQSELKEIEEIGKEVYNNKLDEKISISENFQATYRPDGGLYVFKIPNLDHVTAYLKPNVKNYDKPMLKDKNNAKILTKILLKNN